MEQYLELRQRRIELKEREVKALESIADSLLAVKRYCSPAELNIK